MGYTAVSSLNYELIACLDYQLAVSWFCFLAMPGIFDFSNHRCVSPVLSRRAIHVLNWPLAPSQLRTVA
jgi:hypothetical protein